MNFKQMLTYFQLKNMCSCHRQILNCFISPRSNKRHQLYRVEIRKHKDAYEYAYIIYSCTGPHIALVYADIIYNDAQNNSLDEVRITNAKLRDIEHAMIS